MSGVTFIIPLPCRNVPNRRSRTWHKGARVAKGEREMAWACAMERREGFPPWPWRVTYERLIQKGGRAYDRVNLTAGFKHFEDGVVNDAGGQDDGDPGYEPVYAQRRPSAALGEEGGTVRVTIEPAGGVG